MTFFYRQKETILPIVVSLLVYIYIFYSFVNLDAIVVTGRDLFVFWDGIHRVAQGQIPHVDFESQLGFLNYLGPSLLLSIMENKLAALPAYIFCVSFLIWISYSVLTYDKSGNTIAWIIGSIAIIFFSLSLVRLQPEHAMSFHGYYRRIAAAIFICITVYSLDTEKSDPSFGRAIINAFVLAFLGYVLLFTKITYFIGAFFVLGVSSVVNSDIRKQVVIAAGLFAVAIIINEIAYTGLLAAYIQDIVSAAETGGRRHGRWVELFSSDFWSKKKMLVVFFCFLPITVVCSLQTVKHRNYILKIIACSASVTLAWLFIDNYDDGKRDLEGILGIPLAAIYICERQGLASGIMRHLAKVLVIGSVLWLLWPRVDYSIQMFSRYKAAVEKNSPYAWSETTKFVVGENIERYLDSGKVAVDKLLQHYPRPKLIVFDLANPFSFLYSLEPPTGVKLLIHPNLTISGSNKPELVNLLGDSTHVLIPKSPTWKFASKFMKSSYMDSLKDSAELIYEDDIWEVWQLDEPG